MIRCLPGLCLVFCMAAYPAPEPDFHIPFEKYKLTNGLRVVLSRDTSVPVAAVYLLYDVGARTEEKGAAGFAHLCERLMFDGSANVKKGEYARYVQSNGGEVNASTHLDYTDYYEVLPSNKLALALWLESDRMRGLAVTEESLKNQKEAIRNERQRNYENQAYRAALADKWPSLIFGNPHNERSVMGSPDDLSAATVEDVTKFFRTSYAPNNAVLVISGDFAVADTKKLIEQYFGDIPAQPQPPRPALNEPARNEGRTLDVKDEHARLPAVVVGWPAPRRHSPDWYALDMLDAVLTAGRGSKLQAELMQGRQSVLQIDENLGWPSASPADFKDPGYYAAILIHKTNFKAAEIVDQYQQVIDGIAATGIDGTELRRVKVVLRLGKATGLQTALERARLLGTLELMDGDPGLADRDYAAFQAVTAEQVQAAVRKYLTAARRDVMTITPAPASPAPVAHGAVQ